MNLTPREQNDVETELGLAVLPVEPSPGLKASIMAKIAVTPQLPREADTVMGRAESAAHARWFTRPVTILVAAAAAILLFAGGVFAGNAFAPRTLDTQAASLAELSAAGDLQRASAEVAGGGVATLIWSLDQRRSAVLIDGLSALPAGKTYQLWYLDSEGAATPAGTFEASATGTTWRVLDGAMSGGDTVGVTVEPDGGSPAPTTDPILAITSS